MSKTNTLTVLVPVYNEDAVLDLFHSRIKQVAHRLNEQQIVTEILYINDGSQDKTRLILEKFHQEDSQVSVINLSRNFGKEAAMTAGFDHADGDIVVIIDADLQDPPELITDMVMEWRNGYDIIYAKRSERDGESFLKKLTANIFYRLIGKVSRINIPEDTGDFRLMSKRAVKALNSLREHHRFMKGLFAYIGYPQKALYYHRDPRAAGDTKFNYWKLWNFALEGITSFTITPLKVASYLGSVISIFAFIFGLVIILKTILWGDSVQGYPSMMVAILFMGGVQLLFIGVLGEYLGRIYNESKNRPLYFVEDFHQASKE